MFWQRTTVTSLRVLSAPKTVLLTMSRLSSVVSMVLFNNLNYSNVRITVSVSSSFLNLFQQILTHLVKLLYSQLRLLVHPILL